MSDRGADTSRIRWSTTVGILLGGIAYFATLLNFGTDAARTAVRLGFGSNFFDIQAAAFMDGRLDVPTGSLGIEGFVRDGKTYMYFPPFPALLRLPVMLVTDQFNGRLTLVSMGLAWIVFAVMVVKLFWLTRRCIRGGTAVSAVDAILAAAFLAAATGGTVLTFDAALPWVYHEVYAWAIALVVGALYWLARVALDPNRTAIAWLAFFTLATALTRTTGGWAVSLTAIVVGIWILAGKPHPDRATAGKWIILAGSASLAAAIVYNFVKFGHAYLFPLEDQEWTRVNAHRREALAANGGTITGLQFFETSLVNYFRLDGIRFVDYFPFVTLPAEAARAYGGAFIDQSYRTGSITTFMPLLTALTVLAVPAVFRPRADLARKALRPALVGGVLVTAGVMGYGYLAHRYTSEFVPALVVGGSIGTAVVAGALSRLRRRWATVPLVTAFVGLALFSILAQVLTGYSTASATWRGQKLVDFLTLQREISGGPGSPQASLVVAGPSLPASGSTDQLYIRGSCDGLYLHTGDRYEPWVVVQERDRVAEVSTTADYSRALVPLFTIEGTRERRVSLQVSDELRARVLISLTPTDVYRGPWFEIPRGESVRVALRTVGDLGYAEVIASRGGWVGYVPLVEWDADWNARPGAVRYAFADREVVEGAGLRLTRAQSVPLPLCQQLARDAGLGHLAP